MPRNTQTFTVLYPLQYAVVKKSKDRWLRNYVDMYNISKYIIVFMSIEILILSTKAPLIIFNTTPTSILTVKEVKRLVTILVHVKIIAIWFVGWSL